MRKRRWKSVSDGGVLAIMIAICALPGSAAAQTISSADAEAVGLRIEWIGNSVLNTARDKVRSFGADEDVVYMQSTAGVVTVFNAEDGRKRWARQVGRNDEAGSDATTNATLLAIVVGPELYGFNKFDGNLVIQHRLAGLSSAGAAMDDKRIAIPQVGGVIYVYSLNVLEYLKRYGELPSTETRPYAWKFDIDETISRSPVMGELGMVFTTDLANVHSVAYTGRATYQYLLAETVVAPLAITDSIEGNTESVLMAVGDDTIQSVVATSPSLEWSYPMGRRILNQPAVVGDTVYLVTARDGLSALSRSTGLPVEVLDENGISDQWKVPAVTHLLAVSATRVYGVTTSNDLVVIDRQSAEVLGRMSVAKYTLRHQNTLTDRVYLISQFGQVVCLAEKDSEFAIYHQKPERRPLSIDVPAEDTDPNAAAADDGTDR